MRILHTADWHLCDRNGPIDRTADLQARVEEVATLCESERVDVMVIAGDLFYENASPEQMAAALAHFRGAFKAFFARGGTVVAVTGNHDRDAKVEMIRAGMTLADPHAGANQQFGGGRVYLANRCGVLTLSDPAGRRVQFVLVPYPFASRYDIPVAGYRSREEEHRLVQAEVAKWIGGVPEKDSFDPTIPTVLVAHLHVRGVQAHHLYKLDEGDDVLVDFASLRPDWAYVALGHVHKPQELGGSRHVRYPGPLDRLDFGEKDDPRGVVVFELDGTGLVGDVVWHDLDATPLVDVTVTDPDAALPPAPPRAIVRVTVDCHCQNRDELGRRLKAAYPRLHQIRWPEPPRPDGSVSQFQPKASFAATVRDYLAEKLKDDPDRVALLDLADTFLTPEADR